MPKKFTLVELSDIVNNDNSLGEFVEIKNIVVEDYCRHDLEEDQKWPLYDGTIKKDGNTLLFKGTENRIGIDVTYLHSLRFGTKIIIQGKVCLNKDNMKYILIDDVDWIYGE